MVPLGNCRGSLTNSAATPTKTVPIPSWFIFGSQDKNIPEAAHTFMAQRAKAKETVDVKGASHVVMVSHRDAVVALIKKAAASVVTEPMGRTSSVGGDREGLTRGARLVGRDVLPTIVQCGAATRNESHDYCFP